MFLFYDPDTLRPMRTIDDPAPPEEVARIKAGADGVFIRTKLNRPVNRVRIERRETELIVIDDETGDEMELVREMTPNFPDGDGPITGLPIPCIFVYNGREFPIEDGALDLTIEGVGTHMLTFKADGYLPLTIMRVVGEPGVNTMQKMIIMRERGVLIAEQHARIDAQAETLRARYVTLAPGQAMVYEAKRREAEGVRMQEESEINRADYPHIVVEKERLGVATMREAADVILAKASEWTSLSARIEQARWIAKARIAEAQTEMEMMNIRIEGFDNGE